MLNINKCLLYTYKGCAGSTCSETFLGKHQLKCLRLTKGFQAVEVNGDSYWPRSRKEKDLMAASPQAVLWNEASQVGDLQTLDFSQCLLIYSHQR